MDQTGVERKLIAILVTDVVGYSRLMGDDHEGTLENQVDPCYDSSWRNPFLLAT